MAITEKPFNNRPYGGNPTQTKPKVNDMNNLPKKSQLFADLNPFKPALYNVAYVAQYQVHENYGAHDWDGQGECPNYWKAKGGSERHIATVPAHETHVVDQPKIAIAAKDLADNDVYWRETLITVRTANLNPSTLRKVRDHLRKHEIDADYSYARYLYNFDYEFDWAANELIKRREIQVGSGVGAGYEFINGGF